MEQILGISIEKFATGLDRVRSRLLRVTLAYPRVRSLFVSRSNRLTFLFIFSLLFYLSLSILFPLWVLALGPAIYGVPHLFSSVRYFHYVSSRSINKRELPCKSYGIALAALLMVGLLIYRLLINVNLFHLNVSPLSEWSGSLYLELFGLILTFIIGSRIYRVPLRGYSRGILLLMPLLVSFWIDPMATIGALVLIHNFVAFAVWFKASNKTSEKWVAASAGLTVLAITYAIFAGGFDGVLVALKPDESLPFANMDVDQIAGLIIPWTTGPRLGLHAAIAYAFGQSMHYFVWLKAIPDQYHHHEVPTSFRQSLQLLDKDFGKNSSNLILLIIALFTLTWGFVEFQKMRLIYFALAAFHGYLEIGGLLIAASHSPSSDHEGLSSCPLVIHSA